MSQVSVVLSIRFYSMFHYPYLAFKRMQPLIYASNFFTITNQQSFFPIKVQNSPFPPSLKKCFSHDNCDPMFNLIGFVQYDIESSNFFHYFASFSAFSIPHSYQSFAAVQYFFKTFKNVGPLSQRLSYFPNFNFNFRIGNA